MGASYTIWVHFMPQNNFTSGCNVTLEGYLHFTIDWQTPSNRSSTCTSYLLAIYLLKQDDHTIYWCIVMTTLLDADSIRFNIVATLIEQSQV